MLCRCNGSFRNKSAQHLTVEGTNTPGDQGAVTSEEHQPSGFGAISSALSRQVSVHSNPTTGSKWFIAGNTTGNKFKTKTWEEGKREENVYSNAFRTRLS